MLLILASRAEKKARGNARANHFFDLKSHYQMALN
jgi:hypothetical protein